MTQEQAELCDEGTSMCDKIESAAVTHQEAGVCTG